MRLIYAPSDGEPRELPADFEDWPPADYEAVEGLGRWTSFEDFVDACRSGQRSAWRVALWILLRREQPDLDLEAVQPLAGELAMRFDPLAELRLAELALADPDITDDIREQIEAELPTLRAAAGKDLPESVPAPSRKSAKRASSRSRRS